MGLLIVAVAWGLGSGLFAQQKAVFERAAARDILSRLEGAGAKVRVRVQPRGLAAAWGELESARIEASNFSLSGLPLFVEANRPKAGILDRLELRLQNFTLKGLEVKSLTADIPHCRYDFGLARRSKEIRLSRSGIGVGSVEITEAALGRYILRKFHDIKTCQVKVDRGVIWVEGYGEFLIAKTKFEVIARVTVQDRTKLILTDPKIFFDWVRADPTAAAGLLKILNPVVDLRKDLGLYDAVSVEKIECEGGILRASGATKIPDLPAKIGTSGESKTPPVHLSTVFSFPHPFLLAYR